MERFTFWQLLDKDNTIMKSFVVKGAYLLQAFCFGILIGLKMVHLLDFLIMGIFFFFAYISDNVVFIRTEIK